MNYLDIWIYDSTHRIRVFLCYLLIFIVFFIFSDIMIYFYTKSLYKPIENYEILAQNMEVTVTQAEASNVNGNVKGTVKNNTNEIITNQYLKFEFYTPRDVKIGTKYLKIENLDTGETKEFELGFRFDSVSFVEISDASEEEAKNATPEELELTPVFGPAGLISALILGYFFL